MTCCGAFFLIVVARVSVFCFFPIVAECRENNLNGGIASAFSFDCLLSCGDGLERCGEYVACDGERASFSFVVSVSDKRFDGANGRVFSCFFLCAEQGALCKRDLDADDRCLGCFFA